MRGRSAIFFLTVAGLCPMGALAETLEMPVSALMVAQRISDQTESKFAVGPFRDGAVSFEVVEGTRHSQVWKVRESSLSTSQIMTPLRRQLTEMGYEILLDCKDDDCGGYDFRYALDLVEEPVMHVDLGDFRFLSAWRPGTNEYRNLIVSRSNTGGFVQVDFVDDASASQPASVDTQAGGSVSEPDAIAPVDMIETLLEEGWLSLDDLSFATGSSDLEAGRYASLARLAQFLLDNPGQTVALVGHTDAQGSLAGNIALSQRRAASVLERLVTAYSVPSRQIVAEGVGFLAPRWSNQTEDGRNKNRRVEVILTSTQ
jgi:OOP family OmpA-OmpF porin